ncbi:MAG: N-acetyltransferase family protein [Actinomycetota bacterium]|nr:N-acetyltransferase family protein [Actinomycetota bacterium]
MDEGNATFETCAQSSDKFDAKRVIEHRFVAVYGAGQVLGWVACTRVSDRCVYAGVVEHSVYVAARARGQGVGGALLGNLTLSPDAAGIWTIQCGIFPENHASAALHRVAGFREVGRRERIGRHNGRWRDVVLLERRSPHVQ